MIELQLPCLADRKEDLPLLQRHFIAKFADQYHKQITGISRRAQICLGRHRWPGNVRELENVIGNAAMMVEGNVIDLADLPESVKSRRCEQAEQDSDLVSFEEMQRRHLRRVLERVGGSKAQAAEILGVSRSTVYTMLASLDETQNLAEVQKSQLALAGK